MHGNLKSLSPNHDEWRKHFRDITEDEKKHIKDIMVLSKFIPTTYCNKRIIDRFICREDINKTIKNGKIIEFHYIDGSHRILLRGEEDRFHEALCVVLDLDNKNIVTVYYNSIIDNHNTLHKNLYTKDIDLKRLGLKI